MNQHLQVTGEWKTGSRKNIYDEEQNIFRSFIYKSGQGDTDRER